MGCCESEEVKQDNKRHPLLESEVEYVSSHSEVEASQVIAQLDVKTNPFLSLLFIFSFFY